MNLCKKPEKSNDSILRKWYYRRKFHQVTARFDGNIEVLWVPGGRIKTPCILFLYETKVSKSSAQEKNKQCKGWLMFSKTWVLILLKKTLIKGFSWVGLSAHEFICRQKKVLLKKLGYHADRQQSMNYFWQKNRNVSNNFQSLVGFPQGNWNNMFTVLVFWLSEAFQFFPYHILKIAPSALLECCINSSPSI